MHVQFTIRTYRSRHWNQSLESHDFLILAFWLAYLHAESVEPRIPSKITRPSFGQVHMRVWVWDCSWGCIGLSTQNSILYYVGVLIWTRSGTCKSFKVAYPQKVVNKYHLKKHLLTTSTRPTRTNTAPTSPRNQSLIPWDLMSHWEFQINHAFWVHTHSILRLSFHAATKPPFNYWQIRDNKKWTLSSLNSK